MRPRIVVMAAVLLAATTMGPNAFAHGGGHGDHGGGGRQPGPPPSESPAPPQHRDADRSYHRGVVSFPLSGDQVPGGGDPQGRAQATLRFDPEMELVCLTANWGGLAGNVTGLHVHKGPEGGTGPHHIELMNDENLAGSRNRVEFCVHPEGSADAIQDVVDDPGGYYLNVHTTAFPNGAIRGQLDG